MLHYLISKKIVIIILEVYEMKDVCSHDMVNCNSEKKVYAFSLLELRNELTLLEANKQQNVHFNRIANFINEYIGEIRGS